MSSRNLLLSDRARVTAPRLHEEMERIVEGFLGGQDPAELTQAAIKRLQAQGFGDVDYIDIRANDDLSLVTAPDPARPARLFAAAWLAGVRLIDNIAVE